jgi:aryl-alcohol dehydrogenase-like predicted oxidoreductase
MRTVRLGRTEARVSAVSLGTWAHGGPNVVNGRPVGWYGVDENAVRETLVRAHELGIDHWDTADVYGAGRAEQLIGETWGRVPRDDVFLATKVGWDPGSHGRFYHPEQIRRQLERSLHNLRTDHVDLYYLHHCDFGPNGEYVDEAVALLRKFRDEGKIRFIGLSDWSNEAILHYAEKVDPDVVQCYRNVVDDSYEESGLKAWVEENDVGVAFFSPLKHALLLGIFEGPVTFGYGDHRAALPDFRDYGLISRLQGCRREVENRFADREEPVLHGLLGALLADSPQATVLLGQHRPRHAEAAAKVGEPISPENALWVRRLYQENGKVTRAAWKGFR